MFFALSKVLGFLATPSNAIGLIGVLGLLLLLTRFRRVATACLGASVILLLICGLGPVGDALMLPLSERFPPWQERGGAPAGIVVLGGAISPGVSAARNTVELNAAAERMTAVAELARRYPQARIVFTGGNNNPFGAGETEAAAAGALFRSFGIAPSRIELEDRSRTTDENALFTRDLVRPARRRGVSPRRFYRGGLSCRFPHARLGRCRHAVRLDRRRPRAHRHGDA
jgi:uncharacterized SAM-binding protein YcdF (DUF218 family)